MAKLDSAKEELGWLKVLFAVVVAIDASLAAWISQAYSAALTAAALWINALAYRRIHELEGL